MKCEFCNNKLVLLGNIDYPSLVRCIYCKYDWAPDNILNTF